MKRQKREDRRRQAENVIKRLEPRAAKLDMLAADISVLISCYRSLQNELDRLCPRKLDGNLILGKELRLSAYIGFQAYEIRCFIDRAFGDNLQVIELELNNLYRRMAEELFKDSRMRFRLIPERDVIRLAAAWSFGPKKPSIPPEEPHDGMTSGEGGQG